MLFKDQLISTAKESLVCVVSQCKEHGQYEARFVSVLKRWTSCPACTEASAQKFVHEHLLQATQKAARARDKQASTLRMGEGIAARLRECSMDRLQSEVPSRQAVYDRLHRYVHRHALVAKKGVWALMAGWCGTGKTYAMAAMATELAGPIGQRVMIVRASDVIDRAISGRRGETAERLHWIVEPDFLFVDECSAATCEHSAFFDALDGRYLSGKPVVFAGNAAVTRDSDSVIARQVLGERLGDRLFDNGGQVIRFNWTSLRSAQAEKIF